MKNNLFYAFDLWGIDTGELATALYENACDMDFGDYFETKENDINVIKSGLDALLQSAQDGDHGAQALITALVTGFNLI